MADAPEKKLHRNKSEAASDDRRARLAQTLRANLKRRKQQSRQRKYEQPSTPSQPDTNTD